MHRDGLIKKARNLSVLRYIDVALLIFSNQGHLYEFSNINDSFTMWTIWFERNQNVYYETHYDYCNEVNLWR
ncbi:MADS-box transcription factor [Trema orientale]|uniref:MADS-box transcription factor n=1 Tax=Trema orientale TaxID=63057 RepID=A0A2P5ESM3_TREOI|nr:MADS-box transcription factor [Trema orientale]